MSIKNNSESASPTFNAIVLAGDRESRDALREFSGAAAKALIPIEGTPMILRVLGSLGKSTFIDRAWISGPSRPILQTNAELTALVDEDKIGWRAAKATPSTSAYELMKELGGDTRVLLTTADHPLLTAEIVDYFCRESLASGADLTVGLAPYPLVHASFPEMKKTVLRFSNGEFCGCNLFTFLNAQGREAASFWRQIESERKKPLLLIKLLGWWSIVRYRMGMLSLDEALDRLSKLLGLRVKAVILPFANAAIDVDSVSDFQILQSRAQAGNV